MATELTKRQRETLKAIHALTVRGGVGPTIREIRTALDLASDQTVIEMLERLEKLGLVARDRKQARGISITEKSKFALGIVNSDYANTIDSPTELNDQEQKVFERLSEIDPRLGRMYKGGLFVLRVPGNEDHIAQSAHSMREIIDHLSNKGKALMPAELKKNIEEDRGTRRTIHGLRSLFDPQAGTNIENNPYRHLYDEYQTKLQEIAHHNERMEETPYKALIKGLEYFLLRYVFPSQIDVYRLLEEIIKKGPEGIDPKDLLLLTKKNVESYRFFFKHADARWLQFLRDNKFLDPTPEVGDYLSRTAPVDPKQTLEIFLATVVSVDAWQTKTSFATAASKLPPAFAAQTVKKIIDENWIKEPRAHLLGYRIQDLLKNLLNGKEYEHALALADSLLDVFPKQYGSHGLVDVRGYISEYEYAKILEEINNLPPEDLLPFLKMLVSKLTKAVTVAHADGENGTDDHSFIWRPAIENNAQNHTHDDVEDSIITGIRDMLEKHIGHLVATDRNGKATSELPEILSHTPEYAILSRLKFHIFRLFPKTFKKEIGQAIPNPQLSSEVWHEYSLLVASAFPLLGKRQKDGYFSVIDNQDKADDKFIDSWRVRLISIVRGHLSPAQSKKYSGLLKQAERLDQPHFTSYHMSGFSGPNSPKNESDLQGKDVSEIIEFLKSWKPGDEFFGPSRSGLGMILKGIITKEASKYSKAAELFLSEELRPVYIYNFLSGLIESLKEKTELDWDAILNLVATLIDRAKNGKLTVPEEEKRDRLESDWENVMQEISRLIIRGLDTNSISFKNKNKVWVVVKYLAEHPDPTPEHEDKYGKDNSDPYTMSINTVRGDAFHAVFSYIFWHNREEKGTEKTWVASIPEEVKQLLELHLDPKHDPALTIRSVYGRFFPWMLSYGGKWAQDLIPKVFPLDNIDLRYAAWETYLSNMVFEDAFKLLRPQYELAVRDVKDGKVPKRKYWADATERLAEHAMIAYAFEVDDKKNPFYEYFFSIASGKTRGMAVSLAGRAFVSRDNFPQGERTPDTTVLQRFWDWRLKKSTAPSELREFGWWAKIGKFKDKWMLERLLQTVEKTNGDIDGEFLVMGTLSTLAENYPLLCAKILKFIFTSPNSNSRRDHFAFIYGQELRGALLKILKSNSEEAKKIAHDIIDHLLKLGFEDLRTLGDMTRNNPDKK